jgi:hypothetical protein
MRKVLKRFLLKTEIDFQPVLTIPSPPQTHLSITSINGNLLRISKEKQGWQRGI